MPLAVSALIPVYNGAKYLRETLEAVLAQTYPAAEVIVVDDGSVDNSADIVRSFGSRIRYERIPNAGVDRARNTAAALARSPFLAFCDQDDLWRADKLEKQMALHEANPHLVYSFTNFALVVDGVWSERTKMEDAPSGYLSPTVHVGSAPVILEHSLYDQLLRFQPIWPSTIVIAKRRYEELGGFLEEFGKNPSEDLEFTLRCVDQPPIGIVMEPVVGVRKHPENYSGNALRTVLGQIEILRYALEHHSISDETRALIHDQIAIRRVEASYSAFEVASFPQYLELTTDLPSHLLDGKARLKRHISKLPSPLAKLLHRALVRR